MPKPIYNHDHWRALHKSGCNDCEIARQSGATPSTVFHWRVKSGLPAYPRLGRPKGEKGKHFGTDEVRIGKALKLRQKGLSYYAIGERLGAAEKTVRVALRARGA